MDEVKIQTLYVTLNSTDNLPLKCESEIYDGKLCDTKVTIVEGGILCYVSGEERDNFLRELNELVGRYRI